MRIRIHFFYLTIFYIGSRFLKIITVVQARRNSSRLPNKILLQIGTLTVFETLRLRIEDANHDEIWLATTESRKDDVLAQMAKDWGWKILRGDTLDVLSRFERIIDKAKPDAVVRVTGDNPLSDKYAINRLIEILSKKIKRYSYISDFNYKRYPIGYFPEIVTAERLKHLRKKIDKKDLHHFTHVTSKINLDKENVGKIPETDHFPYFPDARWTLDYQTDLDFLNQLNFASNNHLINFTYLEIYSLINEYPHLASINSSIKQKSIELG